MNLRNRWFYFAMAYVYVIALYLITNRQTLHPFHYLPLTTIDMKMPFWPWTSWIYILVYILPLAVGIMVKRNDEIKPMVFAYMVMATFCATVFFFFPTAYPRPPMDVTTGSWVLHIVRFIDTPANCMPSQHVALGFLSAFYLRKDYRREGNIAIILALLIAVSTLTTKQHYIWDVIAGYFLARVSFLLSQTIRVRVAQ